MFTPSPQKRKREVLLLRRMTVMKTIPAMEQMERKRSRYLGEVFADEEKLIRVMRKRRTL
ncbi:hypothetical protein PC116_g2287 [Phytophthora cactorum]|nr:hypothetical protein PC116_g2287 [Phytophthora cactorum]